MSSRSTASPSPTENLSSNGEDNSISCLSVLSSIEREEKEKEEKEKEEEEEKEKEEEEEKMEEEEEKMEEEEGEKENLGWGAFCICGECGKN